MNSNNIINIGLIGTGRIGRIHAKNITKIPDAKLYGLYDIDLHSAGDLANKYNRIKIFDTAGKLFADKRINAVIICSSTDTHAGFIIDAAHEGKHIFCEKPISFELNRIDAALVAVKKNSVKLQIGFNRRFDKNFYYLFESIHSGKIGDTHIIKITSRDPKPPSLKYIKKSGGLFLDMSIHDFDMARYLTGSEVSCVYASGDARINKQIIKFGDIDTAVCILHFENGVIGIIDNSRQAVYGYDQRVEVFGVKGMLNAGNNVAHQSNLADSEGFHSASLIEYFLERYQESYLLELEDFIDCIVHNKTVKVSGKDGRNAVAIAIAAKKSLIEKRLVYLNEI